MVYIVIIGTRISIYIIDVAIITIFKLTFAREREREETVETKEKSTALNIPNLFFCSR